MSQLTFEELLHFGTDDSHPTEAQPSSIQKTQNMPSLGLSGALWKLEKCHNSSGASRAMGTNWSLRPGTPHLDEETRTFTRSTWLRITHKETTPAPGQSISGVCEATEIMLAEDGIETSLQSTTLRRLRLACDFCLPFSVEACRAAVPLFYSRTAPVRWSARLLSSERLNASGTRWRVVACLDGADAIRTLLPEHDALETLWAHLVKQHPPCHTSTPQGQMIAANFLLRLASKSEEAAVARAVLLSLGAWSDPTFAPRRIAGQLPDEARVWNMEDERAARKAKNQAAQKSA